MDNSKTVNISLKDLYQLLIGDCRYGYTRNNHLMPDAAYDKVKRLFPLMLDADKDYALYTLKQICDECISDELMIHFYDGEDDENHNRKNAIKFISWCLNTIHEHLPDWYPYNYSMYLSNLEKDTEPRYDVYEKIGDRLELKNMIGSHVSEEDLLPFMFQEFTQVTFSKEDNISKDTGKKESIYHMLTPVKKDFIVRHI